MDDMSKMFIDCGLCFRIASPELSCAGKMVLLPMKIDGVVIWKIWVLSTWVEDIPRQPEDVTLLSSPGRNLDESETIKTDVFIIGAGTS